VAHCEIYADAAITPTNMHKCDEIKFVFYKWSYICNFVSYITAIILNENPTANQELRTQMAEPGA